jgi:hypothetical protein
MFLFKSKWADVTIEAINMFTGTKWFFVEKLQYFKYQFTFFLLVAKCLTHNLDNQSWNLQDINIIKFEPLPCKLEHTNIIADTLLATMILKEGRYFSNDFPDSMDR